MVLVPPKALLTVQQDGLKLQAQKEETLISVTVALLRLLSCLHISYFEIYVDE